MSRNGAGTFSLAEPPFVFGDIISETSMNSDLSDIANALTASIANDGQTPILANLPMSNYKHTGVLSTSGSGSRTEYASTATLQDGTTLDAGYTAGTSTAFTASLSPAITAYADKQCFRVQFDEACGNNPTINFNSVGAKKIYKNVSGTPTQLVANDVPANFIGELRYDTALDTASGGFWLMNAAEFNINGLTVEATPATDDKAAIYDTSAAANRGITLDNLMKVAPKPRKTVYDSGSGTFTTNASTKWIRVRLVGGGGGGGGSGTGSSAGDGGVGGNTTFGTLAGNGGAGGQKNSVGLGGAGGSATNGDYNFQGSTGNSGNNVTNNATGGQGGASPFGGAGSGSLAGNAGGAASTNSGSGGGGAGGGATFGSSGGGGAGGFVEAIILSPSASYSYAVGASGTAGTAGTSGVAGGAGAAGIIIVEEWY